MPLDLDEGQLAVDGARLREDHVAGLCVCVVLSRLRLDLLSKLRCSQFLIDGTWAKVGTAFL